MKINKPIIQSTMYFNGFSWHISSLCLNIVFKNDFLFTNSKYKSNFLRIHYGYRVFSKNIF